MQYRTIKPKSVNKIYKVYTASEQPLSQKPGGFRQLPFHSGAKGKCETKICVSSFSLTIHTINKSAMIPCPPCAMESSTA